jgi:2-oxoglutarate/2-oxoacid ferredoxin oxidoreductase subunit beta
MSSAAPAPVAPSGPAGLVASPTAKPGAPLSKKVLVADHPTWCPGCGDFAVLASFYRVLEKLNYPHEKIVTFAGIGCSSRFPYFVNTHGGHFLHGRALPFAAGISLGGDDLHVFVFGGDGDGFSIGGNHLVHTARKNVNLTYVIMDNSVYGLTKKQTSPTSPLGFKSKTDPWGAVDQPINPMRTLLNSGATFVARSHATQVNHMTDMMLRAAKHTGFSVVEILSECVEFYEGAFDAANPRKGGAWTLIDEKKNDGTPEDAARHDVTDEVAAFKLACQPWPGAFGVFYEANARKTKNAVEADLIAKAKERTKNASDVAVLQSTFAKLR